MHWEFWEAPQQTESAGATLCKPRTTLSSRGHQAVGVSRCRMVGLCAACWAEMNHSTGGKNCWAGKVMTFSWYAQRYLFQNTFYGWWIYLPRGPVQVHTYGHPPASWQQWVLSSGFCQSITLALIVWDEGKMPGLSLPFQGYNLLNVMKEMLVQSLHLKKDYARSKLSIFYSNHI